MTGKIRLYMIFLLIISAGVIVYSNSLGNDFVWDDETFVVTNDFIKTPKFFPLYFVSRNALASGDLAQENYRPFLPLSYAADYFFWKLNPMGYHITNLAFHIVNACLLFYLVMLITKDRLIGLFSSLVFLTHPVQTEAVSWISGRADVLFLFFFLSALAAYVKYASSGRLGLYFASLLAFICALLSKEMAATLPFIIIIYDWIYNRIESIGQKAIRYFPFLLILELYVLVRFTILGRLSQTGYWTGDPYTTFLSMLKGIVYYIKLLLFPVGLCADHLTFPISTTIKDYTVLFSFVVVAGLIAVGFFLAKRMKSVSFSILWFFVTIVPVANIIPIKILIAERFLYLPLIGYAILVAVLFRSIFIRFRRKNFVKYSIILLQTVLILTYSYLTIARNNEWADEVIFNETIIKKYPDNPRAHYNLAVAYMRREGKPEKSYREAERTLEIMPDHYRARMLLASQYVQTGRPTEAVRELKRVISIKPDLSDAYMRLAFVYEMQEKYDDAYRQYEKMLAWDFQDPAAKAGIAGLYMMRGEEEKSLKEYEKLLMEKPRHHQGPKHVAAYLALGDLYANSGKGGLARSTWAKVSERFGSETPFGRISGFLTGDVTLRELLLAAERWPAKFKAMSFYYIGTKKERDGDIEGARAYYEKCKEVPTRTIEHVKVLAVRRLKNLP